jgi:LysM repeat protein
MKKNYTPSRLLIILSLALIMSLFLSAMPTGIQVSQAATEKPNCKIFYTVKSGDTLNTIAKKYNINVKVLVDSNPLGEKRWIYVQQPLCIPVTSKTYQKDVPGWTNNVAGDFTAKRVGKNVVISSTNFPKNNSYFVKIDQQTTLSQAMNKIGTFKTGDKKSYKYSYIIPNPLRVGKQLFVCLKENAQTRNNICRPVTK